MPEVTLTLDQVIDAVKRLTPTEREEIPRRVRGGAAARIPYGQWLAEVRQLHERLKGVPSLADAIIEDRADRI